MNRSYDPEEDLENDMIEEEEEAVAELHLHAEDEKRRRACGKRGGGAPPGGLPPTSCQAENCRADLMAAKRYHRRHKVCEFHSKAPVAVVAGLRQRFCQQCSRFHELAEFDEAKRSCRARLAGHNERRRKSWGEYSGEGSSQSQNQNHRGVGFAAPGNSSFKTSHSHMIR